MSLAAWGRAAEAPGPGAMVVRREDVQESREAVRGEVVGHLEGKLRQDERDRDTFHQPDAESEEPYYLAPYNVKGFGSLLEHRTVRSFPSIVINALSQVQCVNYRGLWPEIHRAWFTVDNMLYVWDYLTAESCSVIDELDELIVSVGLVRPNTDVFKEHVKYLVVVCTANMIHLFAAQFSDQTPEGTLELRRTNFSVSTDQIVMRKIVGSSKGRIFAAGGDGCLYEIWYENEADSLLQSLRVANRCRKLNHTSWPVSTLPIVSLVQKYAGFDTSPLIDIAVDDARGELFTLSEKGLIQLYDLGLYADQTTLLKQRDNVFKKAEAWCLSNARPNIFKDGAHRQHIISIHVVPTTESRLAHLVAISNAGFRFYLTTNKSPRERTANGGNYKAASVLNMVQIRFPPRSDIWDNFAMPADPQTRSDRQAYPPDASPTTPASYYKAFYNNGLMVLAERPGTADRAVGFVDEGSAGRGGEAVCEVQLRHGTQDGRGMPVEGSGRISDIGEEPYVVFPIEERERHVDQLRYLMASSASPDHDDNMNGAPGGRGGGGFRRRDVPDAFAADFRKMFEDTGGAHGGHFFSRYGAALKENAEQLTSSRLLVVLTARALHVVAKLRPVDLLCRLLFDHRRTKFEQDFAHIFGSEETCALYASVAARVPVDLGTPAGRGVLGEPVGATVSRDAIDRIKSSIGQERVALPGGGQYGQQQQQQQQQPVVTVQFLGLLLTFSRIIRPVWYKPLVYDENVPVMPIATLFLMPPELNAIITPLATLREVVKALYPNATSTPSPYVLRGEDYHQARAQALFFLIDRSLQALRFLERLAHFWRRSSKVRLPLEPLKEMSFAHLVTSPDAHDRVKSTMRQLLQPAGAVENAAVDDLTRDLSQDAFSYFSRGDQLTYEARMEIRKGLAAEWGSTERRTCALRAADNLVKAAVYWRTPADVDALDGGGPNANHDNGLAFQLLKLAPAEKDVVEAVVDMSMIAATNFGAPPFHASNIGRRNRLSAPLALESERVQLDESDPRRTLSDQERDELRRRCYLMVRDALFWLVDPQFWSSQLPGYLETELRQGAAWNMTQRALESEDEDFHRLLYQSFLEQHRAMDGEGIWRQLLFSVTKPQLVRFLEMYPEDRMENLRYYYLYQERYSSALQVLHNAANGPPSDDVDLEKRIGYLRDALACAKHCRTSGDVSVTAQQVQSIQDQLDVALLQLKVHTKLVAMVRSHPAAQADDIGNVDNLGRGLVQVDAIFKLSQRYTLWEEGLELIHTCNTKGQAAMQVVKDFWLNITYNELPQRARDAKLRSFLQNKAHVVNSRWWSDGRGKKGMGVGQFAPATDVDAQDDNAMYNLMTKVRSLASLLGVGRDGGSVQSPSFALSFICGELEQIETAVDEAMRLDTYKERPYADYRPMPHRAWRELRVLGVQFMDLFTVYWEYFVSLPKDRQGLLRRHALDTLRSITEAWYDALIENVGSGVVLLDNRSRSRVVSSLRKLAPHTTAGSEGYDDIVSSLNRLQQGFHVYPDRLE